MTNNNFQPDHFAHQKMAAGLTDPCMYIVVQSHATESEDLGKFTMGDGVITLWTRKYPGYPRQDEDTQGDRLDWLISALFLLRQELEGGEILGFYRSNSSVEMEAVKMWAWVQGRKVVWLVDPSRTHSVPRAPPPTDRPTLPPPPPAGE